MKLEKTSWGCQGQGLRTAGAQAAPQAGGSVQMCPIQLLVLADQAEPFLCHFGPPWCLLCTLPFLKSH